MSLQLSMQFANRTIEDNLLNKKNQKAFPTGGDLEGA